MLLDHLGEPEAGGAGHGRAARRGQGRPADQGPGWDGDDPRGRRRDRRAHRRDRLARDDPDRSRTAPVARAPTTRRSLASSASPRSSSTRRRCPGDDGYWHESDLRRLRDDIAAEGLTLEALENVPIALLRQGDAGQARLGGPARELLPHHPEHGRGRDRPPRPPLHADLRVADLARDRRVVAARSSRRSTPTWCPAATRWSTRRRRRRSRSASRRCGATTAASSTPRCPSPRRPGSAWRSIPTIRRCPPSVAWRACSTAPRPSAGRWSAAAAARRGAWTCAWDGLGDGRRGGRRAPRDRPAGTEGRIFYVHFRQVQGTVPRFQEALHRRGQLPAGARPPPAHRGRLRWLPAGRPRAAHDRTTRRTGIARGHTPSATCRACWQRIGGGA